MYLAEDKSDDHQSELDEDEFVEVMEVTVDEALTLIEKQHIYDAKTAYALHQHEQACYTQ